MEQPEAAARWTDVITQWGVPDAIANAAPVAPSFVEPAAFAVSDDHDVDAVAYRLASEVLPLSGGTVLDVGAGGGRASLPLAAVANEIIAVDRSRQLLDVFADGARAAHVAHRTTLGEWPDVAEQTPIADLVVCHHVAYSVADLAPFLYELTQHARLAVVLVMSERHPMSGWTAAWKQFWNLERPTGPTAADAVSVLRELGYEPEAVRYPRPDNRRWTADPDHIAIARRRLCLTADHDADLAAMMATNPPTFVDNYVALRWPGGAEGGDITTGDILN